MKAELKTEPGVILPDGTEVWITDTETLMKHPAFKGTVFPVDQVTRAAFDQHYTELQTVLGLHIYVRNHPTFVERSITTTYGKPQQVDPYGTWGTAAEAEEEPTP